jgi:chromosome segregation ATPase
MLSNFGSLFNKTKDILKQVEEKTKGAIANATHSGAPASATSDVAVSHSQPGGDVIARHEKAWARVLQNNAKMATQFAATEEKVVKLAEGSDVKHMQFKELERELGSLDEVSKAVEALQKEMTGMCAELKGLDDALDGHISEREERDLARWQLAAETDTERMEAQRRADLVQAEKQIKVDRERRNRARKAEAHARAEEERKKKDEERAAALEKAKAEKAQADAEALVAKAEKAKAEAEALAEQAAKAKAALEAAKTKEPPQDAVVE